MSCNHIITSGNTYDQNTASGWRINSRKRARNSWVTVLSQHKRIAACRLQHPFADFDRRGFTRTIRTQHPKARALLHLQINPPHRLHRRLPRPRVRQLTTFNRIGHAVPISSLAVARCFRPRIGQNSVRCAIPQLFSHLPISAVHRFYFCDFRDSAMRRRSGSISMTVTLTMSPTPTISDGSRTKRSASCEM